MSNLYDYHVVVRRDDNGSYVAHVPALDAQRELQNVFAMMAEEYAAAGVLSGTMCC